MQKSLTIQNFSLFDDIKIQWSSGLNVIVGENGTGKSQLMKLAYSLSWVSAHQNKAIRQTKDELQKRIADKLVNTCRPEYLGRLVSRKPSRNRCDVEVEFANKSNDFKFSFATNSRTEVKLESAPSNYLDAPPIFIPTREMLSIFPGFTAVYEDQHIEFEETYYDLAKALNANAKKKHSPAVQELIDDLEQLMEGHIKLENGRFYLMSNHAGKGKFEIHLIAEGLRKIAMLAYLLINGSLRDKGTLFWDEPETNLNPKLIVVTAKALVALAQQGYQIIIATHSFFLLKEIDLLTRQTNIAKHFVGLSSEDENGLMKCEQTDNLKSLKNIVALDEEIAQYDREMELRR
jgi:predicted ATPase